MITDIPSSVDNNCGSNPLVGDPANSACDFASNIYTAAVKSGCAIAVPLGIGSMCRWRVVAALLACCNVTVQGSARAANTTGTFCDCRTTYTLGSISLVNNTSTLLPQSATDFTFCSGNLCISPNGSTGIPSCAWGVKDMIWRRNGCQKASSGAPNKTVRVKWCLSYSCSCQPDNDDWTVAIP